MKYIDAEKLKDEIERQIAILDKELKPAAEEDFVSSWASTAKNKRVALQSILSIIASLQQEQPEVDLEKEIDEKWDEFVSSEGEREDFTRITRHFYELGKAKKEK